MELPVGKVGPYQLAELVFPELKAEDSRILVGPDVGLDASVVEFREKVLVMSSDPITGAIKNPSWLSVHVNANDVAAMGASPEWFLINLFLPKGTTRKELKNLIKEAGRACGELGITLVGGHTEVTPGIERILISGAMIGEAPQKRWVSAAGSKPNDAIILTKSIAIEGTFILATDREEELKRELGFETVRKAQDYSKNLSIVKDALTAIDVDGVHAMHDITEGGLVGGMHELADASEVGFSLKSEKVSIKKETREICNYFEIDPLRTISSGSLLICAEMKAAPKIIEKLDKNGVPSTKIGRVLQEKNNRKIDGETVKLPEQDELWKIFEK